VSTPFKHKDAQSQQLATLIANKLVPLALNATTSMDVSGVEIPTHAWMPSMPPAWSATAAPTVVSTDTAILA